MFESGVFGARALASCGRYAAGVLQPLRSCAAQSVTAAGAAFSNAIASAGELPADGPPALIVHQNTFGDGKPLENSLMM